MTISRTALTSLALCGALLGASAPSPLHYPPTPVRPVVDHYGATTVVDPYRWLENGADPAVQRWSAAQTALAERYLHGVPGYAALHARLAVLAAGSTRRFGLQIRNGRYVYLRQEAGAPQPVLVARDGLSGAERVLFDPRTIPGTPAIEAMVLSPDGSKVAFTTQLGGSEAQTIRVVDAASGALLPDVIDHAGGGTTGVAIAWDGDGGGFVHTRFPQHPDGTWPSGGILLYHHALGTPPSSDAYVFGRGLSPKAEYALATSRDGSGLAIFETDGDGVHGSLWIRRGDGPIVRVATPAAGIGDSLDPQIGWAGDALLAVAHGRRPRGEVVAIGPGRTVDTGKVVVPASTLVVEDVAAIPGGFVTLDLDGGDGGIRRFSLDGTPQGTLAIPAVSTVDEFAADPAAGDVIVGYESYTRAPRWYRFDPQAGVLVPTAIGEPTVPTLRRARVSRVYVPSADGTAKIPLEIVGNPRGRATPSVVYAYGMYGAVTQPYYDPLLAAWLERGGVWAQAMVRGGGEYGEAWHFAARHATKTKSSDDLASCARWLAAHGYGDAHHVGIMGGSAGGYLMGLALTRNPSVYRAVVADVGIYDQLRIELTPNGAFNTPEFGTVKNPSDLRWMLAQSPYQHVVRGITYPAVLFQTGKNDPRVDPWNSRKMVARLQAVLRPARDDRSPRPELLVEKAGQGHGIGDSLAQRVDGRAEAYAFFLSQLTAR